jgi:hypothetical protein
LTAPLSDRIDVMSPVDDSPHLEVRAQAHSTKWNQLIFAVGFLSCMATLVLVGGQAGSLLMIPVMFVVWVSGHLMLGPRLIQVNTHDVTVRANGRLGRVILAASSKDVTLVRSGHCWMEAHGTTVWFNRRDWQKLASALAE